MRRKERTYRRLGRQTRAAVGLVYAARHSLWLGPDHLLLVVNRSFSESYKRFYFADIQALTLTRTALGMIESLALAFLAAVMLALTLAALAFAWHPAAAVACGAAAALSGLALLVNFIRGPTCACAIRTAVQTERLYPLRRLKSARRAAALLRARIEAAQGALADAEAARHEAELSAAPAAGGVPPAAPPARAARARALPAPEIAPYRGHAHEWLFAVLIADVCHSCLRFFSGGAALLLLGMAIGMAMIAATVTALARQHRTDLPAATRALTWGALGYLVFTYVYGMIHSTVFSIANPETAGDAWAQLRAMAATSPLDSPGQAVVFIAALIISAVIGFGGLLSLRGHRRRPAGGAPPPLPPPPPA
ncbi:MAG: hypothetical protein FJ225_03270 [Lentisphaerae bacterium]|nr:hypothetical protein [Lentisphaerota bacterium]